MPLAITHFEPAANIGTLPIARAVYLVGTLVVAGSCNADRIGGGLPAAHRGLCLTSMVSVLVSATPPAAAKVVRPRVDDVDEAAPVGAATVV